MNLLCSVHRRCSLYSACVVMLHDVSPPLFNQDHVQQRFPNMRLTFKAMVRIHPAVLCVLALTFLMFLYCGRLTSFHLFSLLSLSLSVTHTHTHTYTHTHTHTKLEMQLHSTPEQRSSENKVSLFSFRKFLKTMMIGASVQVYMF